MAELLYTRATHSRKVLTLSIDARFCFYLEETMTPQEIKDAAKRRTDTTRRTIAAYRKALGISQAELGRHIGCDQFSVSRLENGRRPVYMTELCEIAYVLGVDVMELIRPDGVQ